MPNGAVLNRYWDDLDTPRPESYVQDLQTARQAPGRPANEVYRDLRAAAESGWDFSSRWFGDNATLATIRTTAIVPVDLNSLMYHLETIIAKGCRVQRDTACVYAFTVHAAKRAKAINTYLWNPNGYYGDYDWKLAKPRDNRSPAMLYPLYAGATWPDRAWRIAQQVQEVLLKQGGLVTTTDETDQQWDAPNGWAPLQWVAIEGLTRYKHDALARQIGMRFLATVKGVYASQHKLVEKYVVAGAADTRGGGGGEYPLQDGFGWTNAVTLKLLDAYGPGQ
jgi:alpha,alpha-trehalase